MRPPLRIPSKQTGFSLIEILIVVILLAILGVTGSGMIASSVSTNQSISNDSQTYSAARYALDRISREVRETQYLSATGTMNIDATSSATQLIFWKANLDGSTTKVTFTYTSPSGGVPGSLTMAYDSNSASLLLSNLVDTTPFTAPFKYIAVDGTTETSNLALVRYVRVSLNVKPDYSKSAILPLSTLIYFRNR